jgi:hypothetical protein
MTLSPAMAQSLGAALQTGIHAGVGSNVTLEIYTATHALLLATFNLGIAPMAAATTPSAGDPSILALTGTPYSVTAAATGTAAAYRLKDRDGTVIDSDTGATAVSATPGTAIITVNTTSLTSGGNVDLLSLEYRIPTAVAPVSV